MSNDRDHDHDSLGEHAAAEHPSPVRIKRSRAPVGGIRGRTSVEKPEETTRLPTAAADCEVIEMNDAPAETATTEEPRHKRKQQKQQKQLQQQQKKKQQRNDALLRSRTKPNSVADKNNAKSLAYRIDNILDLNLKFSSSQLEGIFSKSYLAVTRLFFLQYLVYLILFSLCWTVYFIIARSGARSSSGSITNTNDTVESEKVDAVNRGEDDDDYEDEHQLLVVAYLVATTALFLLIFVFILFAELKESRYRQLEKKLHAKALQTKVDTKQAERNLKAEMEKVLRQEAEYNALSEQLQSRHHSIDRLTQLYGRMAYALAALVAVCTLALCVIGLTCAPRSLTPITHFLWCCQSILLVYLIYPFQASVSLAVALATSCLFEWLSMHSAHSAPRHQHAHHHHHHLQHLQPTHPQQERQQQQQQQPQQLLEQESTQAVLAVLIKVLLHASVHLVGSYLKVSMHGVKRATFLKVADMHRDHLAAQRDKDITDSMIKSIMPPLFTRVFDKPNEFKKSVNKVHTMRPLFIYPVKDLSILFADIVGFTRMSSTKTAQELVYLLNDLYGRFDRLCEQAGCEKISTLGDCYYCVSGCLNGRKDHAQCCVDMGLLMVEEIGVFNRAHAVDVNMRVGVHTGNALCGFIGGKRFRFDVWSDDVTFANKMESSGRAGWVHISEDTFRQLDNRYNAEEGNKHLGKATYFVGRENKRVTVAEQLLKLQGGGADVAHIAASTSSGSGSAWHRFSRRSKMRFSRKDHRNGLAAAQNNQTSATATTTTPTTAILQPPSARPTFAAAALAVSATPHELVLQQQRANLQQQQRGLADVADESNTTTTIGGVLGESGATAAAGAKTCGGADQVEQQDRLFMLAVKDVQFFQPDVHPITLRFDTDQEQLYREYLIGSNGGDGSGGGDEDELSRRQVAYAQTSVHSFGGGGGGGGVGGGGGGMTMSRSSTHEFITSISTSRPVARKPPSVWMHSRRLLFLSLFVSLLVNACVFAAYFLAFVLASYEYEYEYERAAMAAYRRSLCVMLLALFAALSAQSLFLLVGLLRCSQLFLDKRGGGATQQDCIEQPPHTHLASTLGEVHNGVYLKSQVLRSRRLRRSTQIKYVLLHLLALSTLAVTPTFIVLTSLPASVSMVKHAWSDDALLLLLLRPHDTSNSSSALTTPQTVTTATATATTTTTATAMTTPAAAQTSTANETVAYGSVQISYASFSSDSVGSVVDAYTVLPGDHSVGDVTNVDETDGQADFRRTMPLPARRRFAQTQTRVNMFGMYALLAFAVALIHFVAFVQLSSLLKTTLAFVFLFVYGLVAVVGIAPIHHSQNGAGESATGSLLAPNLSQAVANHSLTSDQLRHASDSRLPLHFYTTLFIQGFVGQNSVILLDFFLLILLIWIVNRQSELVQRLSFKCDQDAHLRMSNARKQKELANWLIDVVLPAHVLGHVQKKEQYSQNYECVGVLFVSLCNFCDFFEENFEGGRELLRVLNEITLDFDSLLDEPKFQNVEKIKSIGSTFMIASGLCPSSGSGGGGGGGNSSSSNNEQHNGYSGVDIAHLYDLMEFALELIEKLDMFNNEAMSVSHFKFKMRMGFNCGPVTAGVIGTERLLYDIWGDTVNVASRMDSTGQADYLQMPRDVALLLQDRYTLVERGPIDIKGKDQMITYFMNPKDNCKRSS